MTKIEHELRNRIVGLERAVYGQERDFREFGERLAYLERLFNHERIETARDAIRRDPMETFLG